MPVALIDWEEAGPVDPLVELAQACWLNALLFDDDLAEKLGLGSPEARGRQVRMLLDGYELPSMNRVGFMGMVRDFAVLNAANEISSNLASQEGAGLRPAVQGGIADHANHRRRSKTPWRPHRHHRRAPNLGSAMTRHPHIQMIVPGGGIAPDERWRSSLPTLLLPVRVLGALFRRLFMTCLMEFHDAGKLGFFGKLAGLSDRRAFQRHLAPARKKRWVVYAKPPFAGPEAAFAYLPRYTHRVAIANSRLITFDQTGGTFRYKDYRGSGVDRQQVMTWPVNAPGVKRDAP